MDIEVAIVPTEEVYEDERVRKDYGNIKELVASIKRDSLIQPLAVCAQVSEQGRFRLLAGGRRLRAIREAGIKEVAVQIFKNLTALQMKSIELSENIHRKDLTYAEECELCRQINDLQIAIYGKKVSTAPGAEGWSQTDTAELLNMDKSGLFRKIQLSEAIEIFPDLAKFKNENEARKAMESMLRSAAREEIAEKLEAERHATPLDIQRQQLVNAYVLKDFFDGAKEIPDEFADLIEIDPPYGIDLSSQKKMTDLKEITMSKYNEISADQYPIFLDQVIKECRRILKITGWIILWFGPDPWFSTVLRLLRKNDLTVVGLPAMWVKKNEEGGGTLQTVNPIYNLANSYESFFYARRSPAAKIVKQGHFNTFTFPQVPTARKIHPTERPIEMMEDIITTFTELSGHILVPFLGSGNTILAASNLKMKAFGYELTKEYKNAYTIRVFENEPGSYRSYL